MSNFKCPPFEKSTEGEQISNKFIRYWILDIGYWKFQSAFTLIELLVVITISAMVMGLTTASFLTFERNQKLKNAAATLKNDLRFVQSKAATGDKSTNPNCTTAGRSLVGWYLNIGTGDSSYTINSDCRSSTIGDEYFQRPVKTVSFPSGVVMDQRSDTNGSFGCDWGLLRADILFEPLITGATFHRAESQTLRFYYLSSNPPTYEKRVCAGSDLVIILKEQQSGAKWKVTVKSSGDINDAKI